MSLYNIINGVNPLAGILLVALGIEPKDIPRFRDCYWNGKFICIYTRTGGGNREFYESEESCRANYPEDFERSDGYIPQGPWNADLRKLPGFVKDEDDDFDRTYATFYFKPPKKLNEALKKFQAEDATPAQKMHAFIKRLERGESDEQIERVKEAVKPVLQAIVDTIGDK